LANIVIFTDWGKHGVTPGFPEARRLWSLYAISFDSKYFEVSSQYFQPVVEKVVMSMQYLADPTLLLGGDVSLDHFVSQPIKLVVDKVVMSMQSLSDPTPLLGCYAPLYHVVSQPIQPVVEEVVVSMQYSVDPTLLLESIDSTKVIMLMQSSANPTLLLKSVESLREEWD
jgi:hypothetical protein